jgi:hypothetical protein
LITDVFASSPPLHDTPKTAHETAQQNSFIANLDEGHESNPEAASEEELDCFVRFAPRNDEKNGPILLATFPAKPSG